jgi:vacuolar-type H+-ATPase subunit E/Vma4
MANPQELKLRDEILADARKKAERTVARARSEAEKLLQEGQATLAARRDTRLAEARHSADERARAILAGIDQEIRAERLRRQELVLDEIFADARKRLRALPTDERRQILAALAREAIPAVRSPSVRLLAAKADLPLLRELQADLLRSTRVKSLELQAAPEVEDGVIALAEDGARAFLNTFEQRLARQSAELRKQTLATLKA